MNLENIMYDLIDMSDYNNYLMSWIDGIPSEINFWNNYFMTKGLEWSKDFDDSVEYERNFIFEDELYLPETQFIDIGSGPLSNCGSKTEKSKLTVTAVDPLASIYKRIKSQNGIETKIEPIFGMVENLNTQFGENKFDIVHMSNALDHSFNPLYGIAQMLYICKVGGTIILRHADNEAEREQHRGFHQWNLLVEENVFWIWRGSKRININKLLSEYTEITTKPSESDGQCHLVKIKKKKLIPAMENKYYTLMSQNIYLKYLDTVYEKIFKTTLTLSDMNLLFARKAIIYGAKNIAIRLYSMVKNKYENIIFAVTNKENNPSEIMGITVTQIDTINIDINNTIVFIASANETHREEMLMKCKELGMKHIIEIRR